MDVVPLADGAQAVAAGIPGHAVELVIAHMVALKALHMIERETAAISRALRRLFARVKPPSN